MLPVFVIKLRFQDPPNNILEEIVWYKEVEIAQMREKLPLEELQKKLTSAPPTRNFIAALVQVKQNQL